MLICSVSGSSGDIVNKIKRINQIISTFLDANFYVYSFYPTLVLW